MPQNRVLEAIRMNFLPSKRSQNDTEEYAGRTYPSNLLTGKRLIRTYPSNLKC